MNKSDDAVSIRRPTPETQLNIMSVKIFANARRKHEIAIPDTQTATPAILFLTSLSNQAVSIDGDNLDSIEVSFLFELLTA